MWLKIIMIYMIIVDLHLTVGLYHVMASLGSLGLLGEVSHFYYFNLCDFHNYKKLQKVNMCEQRIVQIKLNTQNLMPLNI